MMQKRIAITMGEPGGVGPEVIVKALSISDVRRVCDPVVIGDIEVMRNAIKVAGLSTEIKGLSTLYDLTPSDNIIEVIHLQSPLSLENHPSADSGRIVVEYIKKAVELTVNGLCDAIVTAPISKESLKMAGYPWPGHTEMLAELTGTSEYAMMFVGERLKVILCTIHVPLKDVVRLIGESRVLGTIILAKRGMDMLNIKNPRIGVAGLNPHAGEGGLLGKEDLEIIAPAIEKARDKGINVSGPYPPDVIFHRAYRGDFDIIVSMYHDQGLIPFKMLEFERGVNVTVGLPIIRTSPDHGTGFDIAWKNMADPSSMIEAIRLATKLRLMCNA
jgi:4-hydroxythreonine-4-phosphate dehydrogenase